MALLSPFVPTESPAAGTFEAIYRALEASSRPIIGTAQLRVLAIPILDDNGQVGGGFWGTTVFEWLRIQLLFVPEALRGRGVGRQLMASAEQEARSRGCRGAFVDTFSFQARLFYEKLGYNVFGVLQDFPPGHEQIYLRKLLDDEGGVLG